MDLTAAQRDRAVGAVIGMATGDALGAGYEFQPPNPPDRIAMIGGGIGTFEPGEWTDDTTMAIPILEALARGDDLLDPAVQDWVAEQWVDWAGSPKDIGVTIGSVLGCAGDPVRAVDLSAAARAMYVAGHRAAGNGSLMRTTPIVLGFLDDPQALTAAARAYSDITHGDPVAAEACVLWNHAQRHAVVHAEFDMTVGLSHLPSERQEVWRDHIRVAESGVPRDFRAHNGWVVAALQAAWSAIRGADDSGPEHFEMALRSAVAGGNDADTVAAIAGGLLGARWGVSAIPLKWRRLLHGAPGSRTGQQLVQYSVAAVTGHRWPEMFNEGVRPGPPPVRHPYDEHVWLGDIFALQSLPVEVDAVVSLCRIGTQQGPNGIEAEDHIQVWLLDDPDPRANPHLDLVVRQTVDLIADLRRAGKVVYLHCVQAHSRTPFIAAMYGAHVTGAAPGDVLPQVLAVLPGSSPNAGFLAYMHALSRGMRENSQPTRVSGLTPSTLTATLGAVLRLENREP